MLHHLKWNDGKCIYSFVIISTCLLVVLQCRKSCQVEERAKKNLTEISVALCRFSSCCVENWNCACALVECWRATGWMLLLLFAPGRTPSFSLILIPPPCVLDSDQPSASSSVCLPASRVWGTYRPTTLFSSFPTFTVIMMKNHYLNSHAHLLPAAIEFWKKIRDKSHCCPVWLSRLSN